MKAKNFIRHAFLFTFILSIGATAGFGQGIFGQIKDRVKSEKDRIKSEAEQQKTSMPDAANNPLKNSSGYKWARIEARASWEIRGQKKYETRVYYSDVSPYQTGDAKMIENLAKYFEDGIAAPLKEKGISLSFYDSDITIYPASYSYETTAEAENAKEEKMVNDKDAKYAVYSFVWKYNGKPTGEEMTQPKRIFPVKSAPDAENAKTNEK